MSAQNITILPSQALTTTATGGSIDVSGLRELLVTLNITAASGTAGNFEAYLESSDDDGATWYEILCEDTFKTGTAAPGQETDSLRRDIVSQASIPTAGDKYVARYTKFGRLIRGKVILTGGASPNVTLALKAVGKN